MQEYLPYKLPTNIIDDTHMLFEKHKNINNFVGTTTWYYPLSVFREEF